MDSDSKLCVVEAEIGQLSIASTTATTMAAMTAKSGAAIKLPERVASVISSLPPATATVTVTIQELVVPSPKLEDTCPEIHLSITPEPAAEFHLFPFLPAELRLKIWHFSFLLAPRTIELHARRTHYAADDENHYSGIGSFGTFSHFSPALSSSASSLSNPAAAGPPPKWQSESRNPAALSVSAEARCAALEFYTVRLPLAYNPADHTTHPTGHGSRGIPDSGKSEWDTWTPSWTKQDDIFVREQPGNMLSSSDRVIYLNLETDTVVLLGDLHFGRLSRLLNWFRDQSQQQQKRPGRPKGTGLKRLAMSVAPFSHQVGAATLRAFARTVFADVEEFVLFMYMGRVPPEGWDGGRVVLEDCKRDGDEYRRFLMGRGGQFREGGGWMVVGKSPLRMVEIRFEDGW
ncbi:hypothetical protein QBC37DRAFT_419933 [Rhypophila decipiens]|uniref:2EXR domain-containing protein n=1 Tax=Rhypophila decipiens TaxID=261697 RepID=A0AAN6YAB0_9PEZI|nr:hypothetical protein QBC37DRAFT_419933 [Rhypophila decipiens]